jgi:hypothetical protein
MVCAQTVESTADEVRGDLPAGRSTRHPAPGPPTRDKLPRLLEREMLARAGILRMTSARRGVRSGATLRAAGVRHEARNRADLGLRMVAGSIYQRALPLAWLDSEAEVTSGAFPFPLTTSANDGDAEVVEGRPVAGDRPSEQEGQKSSHSGNSSPAALRLADAGENGEALWSRLVEGSGGVPEAVESALLEGWRRRAEGDEEVKREEELTAKLVVATPCHCRNVRPTRPWSGVCRTRGAAEEDKSQERHVLIDSARFIRTSL